MAYVAFVCPELMDPIPSCLRAFASLAPTQPNCQQPGLWLNATIRGFLPIAEQLATLRLWAHLVPELYAIFGGMCLATSSQPQ